MVTKGASFKRMRIMGRGRTGFGYRRQSHITVKVSRVNFEERIAKACTREQERLWVERRDLVQRLKEGTEDTPLMKRK
jgi:hypothetical protein